jgi:hypothetical protein
MLKVVKNFALAILVLAGITSSMQALPQDGFDTKYYSDSTYTNIVGERYVGCGGGSSMTGVRTDWYDEDSWDCNTSEELYNRRYFCLWMDSDGEPAGCSCNDWTC